MDDEIRLRVLEERVHSIGRSTRETEKCCGALKGDASRLGERVVVLEHDLNGKCADMVHNVETLTERSASGHKQLDLLEKEVNSLRSKLWAAVFTAIGALILDIVRFIH